MLNVEEKKIMYKSKIIFSLLILLFQYTAFAADPSDIYEQQQRAKRQEMEQQYRINEERVNIPVPEQKPQPSLDSSTADVKFFIQDFVIDDCDTKHFQWLHKYTEEYSGKIITLKEIFAIQKQLSDAVLKHGYVTSQVLIPEQDFKNTKTFKFIVVPGYIEDIRFKDENIMGTWRNAFPCGKGYILNSFDLEQGLEQMRRAGNQDVTMQIEPGTKTGWSVVVLDVKRTKSWSIETSWDDAGQKSTGRRELTTGLTLYNPTGLNDILSVGYTKDTVTHDDEFGTYNNNFYYSIPFKNLTFTASKYCNKYRQTTPLMYGDMYRYEGKTDTWELGINSLIHRDNSRKTQLTTKFIRRHKRGEDNFVGRVDNQELDTTAYQVGINHRQYIGQGMVDVLLYYQQGIPTLGAKAGWEDDIEDGATTKYKMLGWNLYYGTPLKTGKIKSRFSTTFRGQLTSDKLYGADHMSIGGRYSVRGFNGENTLAAENGYLLRNELAFQFAKLRHEMYIGLDYGRVWGKSDSFNIGNYLIGAFFGIRGNITKLINYDVFIGTPLKKPKGFKAGKTACGFNVNMSI